VVHYSNTLVSESERVYVCKLVGLENIVLSTVLCKDRLSLSLSLSLSTYNYDVFRAREAFSDNGSRAIIQTRGSNRELEACSQHPAPPPPPNDRTKPAIVRDCSGARDGRSCSACLRCRTGLL